MAEAFLSVFIEVLFDRITSPEVVNFFKGRKLSGAQLSKLEATINTVNGVLSDAEEQQITKSAVKHWLDKLKHAVYEADDLLDEIAYESRRSEVQSRSRRQKVLHFLSSRNPFSQRVDVKLGEILEELKYLVDQKQALGLKEGIGKNPFSEKTPTTCLVDESGVYGRDKDKEVIMKLLLSNESNREDVIPTLGTGGVAKTTNRVRVIPIVGMGGVGKTTLAQLLYNDTEVVSQFDLRAWVYVSDGEFNVVKVSKDILEDFTGTKCHATTLNQIQLQLEEKLKGNKFLLVLDDIWDVDHEKWESLQKPFKFGAPGSKVLITTRDESIASVMRTTPTHRLEGLTDQDCWYLFAKHAFGDENSVVPSDLAVIGEKIVKKCKGLPLAAKTLGALLRFEGDAGEWEKILKSNLWDLPNNKILPALRLSYHYLPSHLKQCFAYCSVFPKDYLFKKEELIMLWAAEGFIHPSKGTNKEMEDIGDDYFKDLVSRSFFQQARGYNSFFVMHDLMHDLAEFVSEEFCFRLEGEDSCRIPENTRHLSYVRTTRDNLLKGTFKGQLLRTFLFLEQYKMSAAIDSEVIKDLLPSLDRVRVLSLSGHHSIVEWPNTFDKLKHLRYLNLSGASIQKLPDSVGSLYNLETLILLQCQNLTELPSNMGQLINLCCLDIRETKLQEMPPYMGNLKELRVLTYFIVGKGSGLGINELKKLQHIRGELTILNLENVINVQDALEANMMVKKHLKKLEFKWSREVENSEHIRDVLKKLQPHANLECLHIIGYGGKLFPCWLGDSFLIKLVSLKLDECKNCLQLPPLGQLTSLKDLSVSGFHKLNSIGPEFYGNCMRKPFESLEVLVFERMSMWHEWEDEAGAFPLLRELYVRDCPNLMRALPSHLPSLRILVVEGCRQLVQTLPKSSFTFVTTLTEASGQLKLTVLSSGLYSLKVNKFHSVETLLQIVEQASLSTCLEEIEIRDYNSLECFRLECFPKLKRLHISGCPNLESLCAPETIENDLSCHPLTIMKGPSFPVIQELYIIDCPKLPVAAWLPFAPIPNKIVVTDISRAIVFQKLLSGLYCLDIQKLPCTERIEMEHLCTNLEEITIENNDLLTCFPLEFFPKLKRLYIRGCPNLKSFSPAGATPGNLISLDSLEVRKHPHIKGRASPNLPTPNITSPYSLCSSNFPPIQELYIRDCPQLLVTILVQWATTIHAMVFADLSWRMVLTKLGSGFHHLYIYKFSTEDIEIEQLCGVFNNVEEFTIEGDDLLQCLPLELFPNLKKLTIDGCSIFQSLNADETTHGEYTCLTHLDIREAPNLLTFPRGGLNAPNLTKLLLWDCLNLISLPQCMCSLLPSLLELHVGKCPKLESFPKDGLPSNLEILHIQSCNALKFIAAGIQIGDSTEIVEFIDEEMMLPSTLTSLVIQEVENLTSLDYKWLNHLTFLKRLVICDCPNLQSVPECMQSLFSSLMHLNIS